MAFAHQKQGPNRVGRERGQERSQARWGVLFAVLASVVMWSVAIMVGIGLAARL